jgi:hypothetical protein
VHNPANSSAHLRHQAQGLSQVRAATAQGQRRKWISVRSVFVADYSGNNTLFWPPDLVSHITSIDGWMDE